MRLCRFYDHIKILSDDFQQARHLEAFRQMCNPQFSFNMDVLQRLEVAHFTSLVFKLELTKFPKMVQGLQNALQELSHSIQQFYPDAAFQINFSAAHITVRSIADYIRQTEKDLQEYVVFARPVTRRWLMRMPETRIYLMGLFAHIHANKGLSVGVRVYPTLPLLQVIRGEIADQLYNSEHNLCLRPETQFHTMLTHSTLMRCRNLDFPISNAAIESFKNVLDRYNKHIFGEIADLQLDDFFIRNGKSDKLLVTDEHNQPVGCEVCLNNEYSESQE